MVGRGRCLQLCRQNCTEQDSLQPWISILCLYQITGWGWVEAWTTRTGKSARSYTGILCSSGMLHRNTVQFRHVTQEYCAVQACYTGILCSSGMFAVIIIIFFSSSSSSSMDEIVCPILALTCCRHFLGHPQSLHPQGL